MSDYNPNYVFTKNFFLLGVKIILENSNGEILLVKRSDKVSRSHGWDLPGGAIDASESPDHAIIREVQEETGIVIEKPSLYSSYLNKEHADEAIILGFHAKTEQTEVTLSWEHEAYEWVTLEKAREMNLPGIYAAMLRDHLNTKF
ncbi:MAG: NUDIX hydrolase [Patescibacteria group bacterium]